MPRYITKPSTASKLETIKFAQEEAKLAILEDKRPKPRNFDHTPYAEIPPPNDAEMRVIQDRLNGIYDRIRAANEQDKYDELMRWSQSPYSP